MQKRSKPKQTHQHTHQHHTWFRAIDHTGGTTHACGASCVEQFIGPSAAQHATNAFIHARSSSFVLYWTRLAEQHACVKRQNEKHAKQHFLLFHTKSLQRKNKAPPMSIKESCNTDRFCQRVKKNRKKKFQKKQQWTLFLCTFVEPNHCTRDNLCR